MKQIKRCLVILVFLAATLPLPLAHAEGGLAFQPYWTFRTEAPPTHVATGDIDGDGAHDVVAVSADGVVQVVANDGVLMWSYETLFTPTGLLVEDVDGDGRAAEIFIYGVEGDLLLSHSQRPVWSYGDSRYQTRGVKQLPRGGVVGRL